MTNDDNQVLLDELRSLRLEQLEAQVDSHRFAHPQKALALKLAISEKKVDRAIFDLVVASVDNQTLLRNGLRRSVMIGNGAGAIATLTFVGTLLGQSTESPLDVDLLYLLGFFVSGLAVAFVSQLVELIISRTSYDVRIDFFIEGSKILDSHRHTNLSRFMILFSWFGIVSSCFLLGFGVIRSFKYLSGLI